MTVEELQEANAKLEARLAKAVQVFGEMKAEKEQLIKERDAALSNSVPTDLSEQLAAKTDALVVAENEIENLKVKVLEANKQSEQNKAAYEQLKNELDERKSQIYGLEADLHKYEEIVAKLNTEKTQLIAAHKEELNQYGNAAAEVEELRKQHEADDSLVAEYRMKYDTANNIHQKNLALIQTKLTASEQVIEDQIAKINELTEEIEKRDSTIKTMHTQGTKIVNDMRNISNEFMSNFDIFK